MHTPIRPHTRDHGVGPDDAVMHATLWGLELVVATDSILICRRRRLLLAWSCRSARLLRRLYESVVLPWELRLGQAVHCAVVLLGCRARLTLSSRCILRLSLDVVVRHSPSFGVL